MPDTIADAASETNSVSSSFRPRFIGRLSLTKSDGTVRYFNIKRSILIGRGSECDIRIKVKTVSRVHCKVRVVAPETPTVASSSPAQFVLENVSTTNFTVVNTVEVSGQVGLQDGDIITVAERDFVFQLIDTNEAPAAGEGGGASPGQIALGYEGGGGGRAQGGASGSGGSNSMGIYSIFCGSPSSGGGGGGGDQQRPEGEGGGGCVLM